MPERKSLDVHQAYQRYVAAVEQLQRVSHYLDKNFLGRAATESELATVAERAKAKEAALRKICALPCADIKGLHSKAKVLNTILLTGETLSGFEQKALVQSILQMAKPADKI